MKDALKTQVMQKFSKGLKALGATGIPSDQIATLREKFQQGLDAHLDKMRKLARHDARRDAIQQIYMAAISKCLAHAQLQILHKLHAGTAKIKNTEPAAADLMFNMDDFENMFFSSMRQAGEDALAVSGQGLLSELGIDKKYITPHGLIHDFTITRQNKLEGVPDEIYDEVKAELQEGVQKGESEDQLAQRVANVFGSIDAGRAQTIARTETASAYGQGRMDSMQQAGFTHKAWLTADDERVRLSHNECQAQGPIPADEAFSNGLMFPGDPDGPPEEVINCRCVVQAADAPEGEEAEV